MDGVTNTLDVVLTRTPKFDGTKADEFLEWSSKRRASLSFYLVQRSHLEHGKNDRRRPTTIRPPPVRRGMPLPRSV